MEKVNVFVMSKDGTFIEEELINFLLETIRKREYEIVNAPAMAHILMKAAYEKGSVIKNAINAPNYLLDEISNSDYPVIVIALDSDSEGFPHPRFFVGDYEIQMLIKGLEENPDIDAWKTAVEVNKTIRKAET